MLRSRVSWAHGSLGSPLILNGHINTDGTIDEELVRDTYLITRREYDPAFRDGRDPLHLGQGGTLGRSHKGMAFWRLRGRILVPDTQTMSGEMDDKERELRAAFDPALCVNDSPSTEGAYALDWTEPTLDTSNFPTGIPTRIYARPTVQPLVTEDLHTRSARDFAIGLVAADPRKYHQTSTGLVLSPGTPSGNLINRGNVPAPLRAQIAMTGAGNSAFTITRGGVAFILNLTSTVNLDVVTVIFETCGPFGRGRFITKNSVENAALKTSAADTWLTAPVGTTQFVISNHTNVSTCTLSWHHAWA